MDGSSFYDSVSGHPELKLLGLSGGAVLVKHVPTKAVFSVKPAAAKSADWQTLESIFCGKRPARVLSHMTRIVGYYSQIENWNKSKLGELADRRRGKYAVPTAAPEGVVAAAG
jgi:hypothetical protein